MKLLMIGTIAAAVFLAACEDPAANKTKAVVSNSTTNASNVDSNNQNMANGTSPVVKGTALAITPENSKIEFIGSKVTGKHVGGFKEFTGTIDLVGEKALESSVSVDIVMGSVFTDADGLTDHLKTVDFFEAEKFPRSTFRSTKIVADTSKGEGNYMVTGDLTLRGVTKSITFPATIKVAEKDVAVNAEFVINRKDFGILYPGQADNLINDDVVLRLDLTTSRKI
jgi:polyisoprenoid-binding protein YceI